MCGQILCKIIVVQAIKGWGADVVQAIKRCGIGRCPGAARHEADGLRQFLHGSSKLREFCREVRFDSDSGLCAAYVEPRRMIFSEHPKRVGDLMQTVRDIVEWVFS